MLSTIYHTTTGQPRTADYNFCVSTVQNSRGEWSFRPPLPAGWDLSIPKYRVTMDVIPAEKPRFRFEPPFTSISDNSVWQYAERPLAAGTEIETTSWPHATFLPINESAKAIHKFFRSAPKSRLPLSPWRDGRLHLDDGLTAPEVSVTTAKPEPVRDAQGPRRAIGR
jgi:hypothetical protein